jgi:hypothetical protein
MITGHTGTPKYDYGRDRNTKVWLREREEHQKMITGRTGTPKYDYWTERNAKL